MKLMENARVIEIPSFKVANYRERQSVSQSVSEVEASKRRAATVSLHESERRVLLILLHTRALLSI